MANYASTVLLAARAKQQEKYFRKFEGRPENSMLMDMFMKDRDLMFPDLGDIRQATTQTTTMLYPVKILRTIGSAKSCSISADVGDSGSVDLTWYTKTADVTVSEKRHHGNEYKMVETLAREMLDAEIDLWKNGAASMEVALLAYLEANRTQAAQATGTHFTWDAVNYNYDCAFADLSNFYNYLLDDLKLNNYTGEFLDAFNTTWGGYLRQQTNQGESNATNTKFQYLDPFDFVGYDSNLITNGTSDLTTHYVIPQGGITILDWNDPVNREGKVSGEKEWGLYESRLFPGLMLDLFTVTECADTTESGGGTQDFVHSYQIAFNYAIAKAPSSTVGETPIVKTNILSS